MDSPQILDPILGMRKVAVALAPMAASFIGRVTPTPDTAGLDAESMTKGKMFCKDV